MSGKKRRRRGAASPAGAALLLILVLAAGLLLLLRSRQQAPGVPEPTAAPFPAVTAAPEPTPTPEQTPPPEPTPTPCPHSWSEGVCQLCGEVCLHETHAADDAVCLQCGAQRYHHYESGVCTGCGREPLVYTEPLPAEYYEKPEERGTHRREFYPYRGQQYPLAIWLPRDYSEEQKYNVILLMPGDKSFFNAWIDQDLTAPGGGSVYDMSYIYDHVAEQHLCDPFIVVGISNYFGVDASVAGKWICEGILPYLAENYSTWAEGSDAESLKAAREHFAIGGLSRGSIQTYDIGMCWCLEYFANFAAFSNMSYAEPVAARLNSEACRELGIRCYYATWGLQDKDYCQRQEEGFHTVVDQVERLIEGENAFGQPIDSNHSWDTWSTSFVDAIQVLF